MLHPKAQLLKYSTLQAWEVLVHVQGGLWSSRLCCYVTKCPGCNRHFYAQTLGKKTCSDKCRKRVNRDAKKPPYISPLPKIDRIWPDETPF